MQITPKYSNGYKLMHDSILTLAQIEDTGMCIDVDYCLKQQTYLDKKVKHLEQKIYNDPGIKEWKRLYKSDFNINSSAQLGSIIFDYMGVTPTVITATGKPAVSKEALDALADDVPFVNDVLNVRKLKKAKDTYIANLLRESVDGILRPSFSLHTVKTFRSCIAKYETVLTIQKNKTHAQNVLIKDIKVGDKVYCLDNNLQPCIRSVLWQGSTGYKDIVRVHYRRKGKRGHFDCTHDHRIRLASGEYVEAQYLLKQKDTSVLAGYFHRNALAFTSDYCESDKPIVHTITDVEDLCTDEEVYDLEIEEFHNFFVNEICVHNSSQNLNFQNIPIRDPEIKKIIRRAFIPRRGHLFGGVDFGSMEVRIAACYHKDPNMLRYIKDPSTDMHRDVAMDCYAIDTPELVHADARQVAKGGFTFAELYGDYYEHCAKNLWEPLHKLKLNDAQGTPLKTHLESIGIRNIADFTEHIRKVEDKFWNERFAVYTQWKKDWKKAYDRDGYFDMYTGFRCSGFMKKNNVLNYQIQGAAFHCLLWTLNKLHAWLTKYNFKTKIVGQIHDEIVLDMHESEVDVVLAKCRQIMTVDIIEAWPWIIVPLVVDADFCPPDETWYTKTGLPLPTKDYRQLWRAHRKGYKSVVHTYDCNECGKVHITTTSLQESKICKCTGAFIKRNNDKKQ